MYTRTKLKVCKTLTWHSYDMTCIWRPLAYSEPCKTFEVEHLNEIVHDFYLLRISVKWFILHVNRVLNTHLSCTFNLVLCVSWESISYNWKHSTQWILLETSTVQDKHPGWYTFPWPFKIRSVTFWWNISQSSNESYTEKYIN